MAKVPTVVTKGKGKDKNTMRKVCRCGVHPRCAKIGFPTYKAMRGHYLTHLARGEIDGVEADRDVWYTILPGVYRDEIENELNAQKVARAERVRVRRAAGKKAASSKTVQKNATEAGKTAAAAARLSANDATVASNSSLPKETLEQSEEDTPAEVIATEENMDVDSNTTKGSILDELKEKATTAVPFDLPTLDELGTLSLNSAEDSESSKDSGEEASSYERKYGSGTRRRKSKRQQELRSKAKDSQKGKDITQLLSEDLPQTSARAMHAKKATKMKKILSKTEKRAEKEARRKEKAERLAKRKAQFYAWSKANPVAKAKKKKSSKAVASSGAKVKAKGSGGLSSRKGAGHRKGQVPPAEVCEGAAELSGDDGLLLNEDLDAKEQEVADKNMPAAAGSKKKTSKKSKAAAKKKKGSVHWAADLAKDANLDSDSDKENADAGNGNGDGNGSGSDESDSESESDESSSELESEESESEEEIEAEPELESEESDDRSARRRSKHCRGRARGASAHKSAGRGPRSRKRSRASAEKTDGASATLIESVKGLGLTIAQAAGGGAAAARLKQDKIVLLKPTMAKLTSGSEVIDCTKQRTCEFIASVCGASLDDAKMETFLDQRMLQRKLVIETGDLRVRSVSTLLHGKLIIEHAASVQMLGRALLRYERLQPAGASLCHLAQKILGGIHGLFNALSIKDITVVTALNDGLFVNEFDANEFLGNQGLSRGLPRAKRLKVSLKALGGTTTPAKGKPAKKRRKKDKGKKKDKVKKGNN